MFDANEHMRAKCRYVNEHYAELAGKHVAWAFDGTLICSAGTLAELLDTLGERVCDDCVLDYIDPMPVVIPPAIPLSRAS